MSLGMLDLAVISLTGNIFLFVLLIYIRFKYFKPEARRLNYILRKGLDVLFLTFDDGRTFIKPVAQISKEGVLKGERKEEYFILPEIPSQESGDRISEIIAKRSILESTGTSVFFGYAGQLVAYTPYMATLGSFMVDEKKTAELEAKLKENGRQNIIVFSARQLKAIMERSFSPAAVVQIMSDLENRIRAEMSQGKMGRMMNFMYVLIGLVVVAVVLKIVGVV